MTDEQRAKMAERLRRMAADLEAIASRLRGGSPLAAAAAKDAAKLAWQAGARADRRE